MKTYTILLLRPDYMTDNYVRDTYLTSAKGKTVEDAIIKARLEAVREDDPTADPEDATDDYAVLLCIEGDHDDLTPPDFRA
jgi:hypothetical protein